MNRIFCLFLFFVYISCSNFSYAIGSDSRTNRVEMARADKISISVESVRKTEKISGVSIVVEEISKANFLDKTDIEIERIMRAALAGRTDIEIERIMRAALAGRTDIEIERIMRASMAAYDKPDKSAFLVKMVEMCDWSDIEVADVTPANNVDRFNVDFFDCIDGRGVFVYLCKELKIARINNDKEKEEKLSKAILQEFYRDNEAEKPEEMVD